ncbi:MAG: hypothetical protein ONB43_18225 [candidate division KSB1 bacterium]|nr:hypothetical protein [candidate division KSB1 bacterium]MDZ7406632.1 hypothetical protein [candidate division KSB1 bacterium]
MGKIWLENKLRISEKLSVKQCWKLTVNPKELNGNGLSLQPFPFFFSMLPGMAPP